MFKTHLKYVYIAAVLLLASGPWGSLFTGKDATWYFPPEGDWGTIDASTNSGADVVTFRGVVLENGRVFDTVAVIIKTGEAGKFCSVGIYNSSGSRVVTSGALDASSSQNLTASFTNINLPAGFYYVAWTCNHATPNFFGVAFLGSATFGGVRSFQNSLSVPLLITTGTAANSSVAGVLPVTLGALTYAAVIPPAMSFGDINP